MSIRAWENHAREKAGLPPLPSLSPERRAYVDALWEKAGGRPWIAREEEWARERDQRMEQQRRVANNKLARQRAEEEKKLRAKEWLASQRAEQRRQRKIAKLLAELVELGWKP